MGVDFSEVCVVHLLPDERTVQGEVRMEPDDAGLQPQTGAQLGELCQFDASGGHESNTNGLMQAHAHFFTSQTL